MITTDQVPTQGRSPQAEDLCWEFQLQLDRSAILLHIAAATTRAPSPELPGRQEDWDCTHYLGKWKPSINHASFVTPLSVQAPMEILDHTPQVTDTLSPGSSDKLQQQEEPAPPENNVKETDERPLKGSKAGEAEVPVAKKERTFKVPLMVQAVLLQDSSSNEGHLIPASHNHASTSHAVDKTEEETTTSDSYCDEAPDLSRERTTQWLLVTKPANVLDLCSMMWHKRLLTVSRGRGQSSAFDYPFRFAVTGTTRHQSPDRAAPYTESTDLRTSREHNGYGASSMTCPSQSWHSTPLPYHDRNDRVRLPPDDLHDRRTTQKIFLPGLGSNQLRELLPSPSPQGFPFRDDQGLAIAPNVHWHSDLALRNTFHDAPSLKTSVTTTVHQNKQPTRAHQPIQPRDAQPLRKASHSQAPSGSRATLDTAVTLGYLVAPNHSDSRVLDATADAPFGLPFIGPYQVTTAFCSDRSYNPARRNLTCLPSSRTTTSAHQDQEIANVSTHRCYTDSGGKFHCPRWRRRHDLTDGTEHSQALLAWHGISPEDVLHLNHSRRYHTKNKPGRGVKRHLRTTRQDLGRTAISEEETDARNCCNYYRTYTQVTRIHKGRHKRPPSK